MATLKEIIQYSKANPDTDYARKALSLIQAGQFDQQAQQEGIDLSWAGRPSAGGAAAKDRPGLLESVGSAFGERVEGIAEAKGRMEAGKQGLPSTLLQATGETAGFAGDLLFEGVNALTGGLLKKGTEAVGDTIGQNETAQKVIGGISDWAKKHPEAAANLEAAINIGSLIPAGKGLQLGVKTTKKTVESGIEATTRAVAATEEAAASAADSFKSLTDSVSTYTKKLGKDELSAGNVDPRVQTSAQRIQDNILNAEGVGAARRPDVTKSYKEFLAQEKQFKADVKADTAAGLVGSRIGDQFRSVVQLRREAGKTMQEELEKVGGIATKLDDPAADFDRTLAAEGLEKGEEGLKSTATQSRYTAQDISLLDKYSDELRTLGNSPSIADLDAFVGRMDSELDLFKSQNHIMGTTPGERLVKMHLHDLRKQFEPEVSGKELEAYRAARGAYAELSGFIKEGMQYLGKETQSGDFAKDASLAKSAVQSLLNNGKKDWLIKLEALTGYPALDEAMLAFQAMQDVGNPMGHSLLELVTKTGEKGGLPLSKSSILDRLAHWATGKARQGYIGTPEEQTLRFLESLKKRPTDQK